jgi:uncharacterized protein
MTRSTIEMTVSQLTVDPHTNTPLVILKDATGNESLPLWVGAAEAGAISTALERIAFMRPMTHDLLHSIVGACGATVERVEITGVADGHFTACLRIRQGERKKGIAARASDAIAVALRAGAPIRVSRKVLAQCQRPDLRELHPQPPTINPDDILAGLADEDFGKWKM